jgi:hypothetical protein
LKFLVIAALLALLLLLVYSRIYPYLQFVKKILGVAKTIGNDRPAAPTERSGSSTAKSERKLVRCVGCGTWIPAERAIGSRVGAPVYCSRECVEKQSNDQERKIAG